jgi:hypothetical protein
LANQGIDRQVAKLAHPQNGDSAPQAENSNGGCPTCYHQNLLAKNLIQCVVSQFGLS